jgi:hypothetical protein
VLNHDRSAVYAQFTLPTLPNKRLCSHCVHLSCTSPPHLLPLYAPSSSPHAQGREAEFNIGYGGTVAEARAALKGSFIVNAYNGVGSRPYDSLLGRLRTRYPTPAPPCGAAAAVTDDDGNAIDLRDHDSDSA